MADVYGVNTTKVNAGTQNGNWVDQGLIKSSLKIMTDVYEAAALAAGQTIGIANLPAGAVVHGIIVENDALGAATIDVGDSDNPDRYVDGLDVSAAGSAFGILPDGAQYVIGTNTGDTEIIVTVLDAAITGTLKVSVLYTN